jgi:uncharacterized protein YjcR
MKTTSCTESRRYAFESAPRCGASTKRYNGRPCRSPSVRGKRRCRMHGGAKGSGAKKGNQNALKHGVTTREIKRFRQSVKQLISSSRGLHKKLLSSLP